MDRDIVGGDGRIVMLPRAVGRKGRKMGGEMNTLTWRGLAVGRLSALNILPVVGQMETQ
jgi:hypothetical protein